MKRFLIPFALGVMVVCVLAATVKISDLPLATNPSTNTFIEIADMNAVTKSSKFLFNGVTYKSVTNGMGWSGDTNNVIGGDGRERSLPSTTNFVAKAGDTMTGNLIAPNFLISPAVLSATGSTNVVVDLSLSGLRTCALSTNAFFTSQNLSAGASVAIRLTNSASGTITLAFTNTWPTPLGSAAPTQLLAGKVAVLAVTSWGTTEPEFTWTYAVQP